MTGLRTLNVMSENSLRRQEQAIEAVLRAVPAPVVGGRLRRARIAQQISIRDLAAQAGLSKNSITRLEKGEEARAITILKVCSALGLHIERLAEPEVKDSVAVHRSGDDQWFDMTDFGAGPLDGEGRPLSAEERKAFVGKGVQSPLLMLRSRLDQGKVLPSILELHKASPTRSHPGEEFVYVLKGTAKITIGSNDYLLSEGESLNFWGTEPHSYAPGGTEPALILSLRVNP